jgi:RecB family exonuclease
MTNRSDRLKQIVKLQKKVTEIHEMRRANFLAQAAAADREAKEILEARNEGSMSNLFPEVYSRFVEKAVARARENEALAQAEGLKVAAETARTNIVERTWREALRDEERKAEERAALDAVEQRLALK